MENRKSFNADAMVVGFVIGLALLAVDLLSALAGAATPRNILILIAMVFGSAYFTRKRAALAGGAGMSYGDCVGFIAMSMLYAGILVGIGDVILYKMVVPGYYGELVDAQLKASARILRSNPLFGGNREQLKQSLDISRAVMHNPVMMILRNIFNVTLSGVLVGLLVAPFCKRARDPFHEAENE